MKHLGTAVLLSYSLLVTVLWCNARMAPCSSGISSGEVQAKNPSAGSRANPRTHGGEPHRLAKVQSKLTENAPSGGVNRLDWAALESTDFATYVANLRTSGCPEDTVRRIVAAEIRETFDRDRLALLEQEPIPFWDAAYGAKESGGPEFESLAAEENGMLCSLLGPDVVANLGDPTQRMPSTWRFGPKLAGKGQAVTDILASADARIEEILASISGEETTPAQQEMLTQIEADKAAALAATLTPEEQNDFEIRNSALADEIRAHLTAEGRQASESQFRAMFEARKMLAAEIEKAAVSGAELGSAWTSYHATISDILQRQADQ